MEGNTAVSIRKGFLILGWGTGTPDYGTAQFCSQSSNMDSSRAQSKEAKTDKHQTLFLASKCSPGTVLVILLSMYHVKLYR